MTAAAANRLVLRVTLGDTWTPAVVDAAADERLAAVKARVLAGAHIEAAGAAGYEVKFGGALVRDESRTLGDLGVRSGSSLMILSRRRRPVR